MAKHKKQRRGARRKHKPSRKVNQAPTQAISQATKATAARHQAELVPIPYDPYLLERARTQWQFGDWSSLVALAEQDLEHHPDRDKLAILAAAGFAQQGDVARAKQYVRLASDWGCDPKLIKQVMIAGVYNSLGKASAAAGQVGRAADHFETAIATGMPGSYTPLLGQARQRYQQDQLDISQESMLSRCTKDSVKFNKPEPPYGKYIEVEVDFKNLFAFKKGKVVDKWSSYLESYEKILSSRRREIKSMLEIGIQHGGSVDIWLEYLENLEYLVGVDVNEKCRELFFPENVDLVIGDSTSEEVKNIIRRYGSFDTIIDDGSHKSQEIIDNFINYFPMLPERGLYIIEDLHCSYWNEFGGGLCKEKSAINFLKLLVDVVNYEHWSKVSEISEYIQEETGLDMSGETEFLSCLRSVKEITFLNSMVIVEQGKAANTIGERVVSGNVGIGDVASYVKKFKGFSSSQFNFTQSR